MFLISKGKEAMVELKLFGFLSLELKIRWKQSAAQKSRGEWQFQNVLKVYQQ
jgi:hypothetical protein